MEIITQMPVTWAKHSLNIVGAFGKYYVKMELDAVEGRYLASRIKAAINKARTNGAIPQNCSPAIVNIQGGLENLAANGGEVSANSGTRPAVFDLDENELSIDEVAKIEPGAKGRVMIDTEILFLNGVPIVRLELLALQLSTADSQSVRHFSSCPFLNDSGSASDSAADTDDFLC